MTAAAWVLASALIIVFLAALLMDWWDERLYRQEREQDRAHDEPPSRLDDWDGLRP